MCRSNQDTNTSGPAQEILDISHWRAATALMSLSIGAAPPEPSLLAFTKYGTKVSQHKRFWSLIALMSSDGSYGPNHFAQFSQCLCILHTQSMVVKQQTQEGQHKEILVLIASASSDGSCKHRHYAIKPEPSLHACTRYGSRGRARQSLRPPTH